MLGVGVTSNIGLGFGPLARHWSRFLFSHLPLLGRTDGGLPALLTARMPNGRRVLFGRRR